MNCYLPRYHHQCMNCYLPRYHHQCMNCPKKHIQPYVSNICLPYKCQTCNEQITTKSVYTINVNMELSSELVMPIMISWIDGCCPRRKMPSKSFLVVKMTSSHRKFYDRNSNMTWSIVMEYLCHKWPRICYVSHKHNPILSSFMSYSRICNKSNMAGVTSGAGTASPSEALAFTPRFLVWFVLANL